MSEQFYARIFSKVSELKQKGEFKNTQFLSGPQAPTVEMEDLGEVLVMSSNNYLGLANHPKVREAAKAAIDKYGNGTASVRFICGTLSLHRELEAATAKFLGFERCTTYASCWNANEAVFQTLFGEGDIVISDRLNHASLIDGLRLMKKAEKTVYPHSDMNALEDILKKSMAYQTRAIVTDGVFSMEGDIAKLPEIVALAEKYNALVIMDDSHATGVLGDAGRGTAEHFGLEGKVDILTGTYGKALGGGLGGYVVAKSDVVEMLVQQSRPQLFSNALPPAVAGVALAAIEVLESNHAELLAQLRENTAYFRNAITEKGFKPLEGDTPIVPIILGETARAIEMSTELLKQGIFVTGFGYPVVPQGEARLRIQISAAHTKGHLDRAIEKMRGVGRELNLI